MRQAGWTKAARAYVLGQTGLSSSSIALDVGCGTGALYRLNGLGTTIGVDIDRGALDFFKHEYPSAALIHADAADLPMPDGMFDAAFAHFLMLWVRDPSKVVREMARVVKPGGWVIFFAEPDHDRRIDHPMVNEKFGEWQSISLRTQGADTSIGRRLGSILTGAGLEDVKFGLLGGEWRSDAVTDADEERILAHDLENIGRDGRYLAGSGAFSFVPTFYAFGRRYADGIISL